LVIICSWFLLPNKAVGQSALEKRPVLAQVIDTVATGDGQSISKAKGNKSASHVDPPLEPKSDKKFFKKDYPEDVRAEAIRRFRLYNFNHPYPSVQDSEDYARDYVKDENSDNGEWKAQAGYDILRQKLQKENAHIIEAVKKEAEAKQKVSTAQEDQKKTDSQYEAAKAKVQAATNKLKEAEEALKKKGGDINSAISKVQQEMKDLEKCKEQLEKARSDLKRMMATKQMKEQTHMMVKATVEKELKEQAEATTVLTLSGRRIKSWSDVSDLKRDIIEKQAVAKVDEQSVAAQEARVKASEEALQNAAEKLRRTRTKHSNSTNITAYFKPYIGDRSAVAEKAFLQICLTVMLSSLVAMSSSMWT